jgi:cupin 2 domain-containing protein
LAIDLANLFESLPEDISNEIFSELVRGDNIKIERIVSHGHACPASGWYDQAEHEWVAVLKGAAKIAFENGEEVHLIHGNHLTIPAHTKHKVTWTTPDTETIWLAVHYK